MPKLATRLLVPLHLAAAVAGIGCGDSPDATEEVGSMRAKSNVSTPWLCPVSDAARGASVHYSFNVVEFASRMPVKGLEAKACTNSDVDCEKPLATFVDTDETSKVELDLPNAFTGYVEVKSEALDTLLYVTNPIVKDTVDRDLTVPTADTVALFATLLDYSWDMDKGIVVLEVLDCDEAPQGGIHFDSLAGGDGFYIIDEMPDKSAQMTVFDPAANTAEGGFLNVPPGTASFSGQSGADASAVALGTFQAQVRPRTLTVIVLHH